MVDSVNVWKPQDELEDVGSHYSPNATVETALQEVAVLAKTPAPSGDFIGALAGLSAAVLGIGDRTELICGFGDSYDTSDIHDDAANEERFIIPLGVTYAKMTAFISFAASTNFVLYASNDGGVLGLTNPAGGRGQEFTAIDGILVTAWFPVAGYTYLTCICNSITAGTLDLGLSPYVGVEFK